MYRIPRDQVLIGNPGFIAKQDATGVQLHIVVRYRRETYAHQVNPFAAVFTLVCLENRFARAGRGM